MLLLSQLKSETPPQIVTNCLLVGDILVSPAYIWNFSNLCEYTFLENLLLLMTEFLSLYVFSDSYNSWGWAGENFSFVFQRVAL